MKYTAIALMSVAGAVKVEDAPNYTMWYVDGFRGWFLHFCIKCTAKINMMCIGCFFIDIKNVTVDYGEYLGPEWNKNGIDFDKCGSIVVNH